MQDIIRRNLGCGRFRIKELKLSRVSQDRSKNLTLEWSRIPASVSVMNHSSGPLTLGHVNIETTRCSTSQRRRAEGRILRHCLSYKNAACLSTFCSFFMTFSKVLRQLKLTNNVWFQAEELGS